MHHDILVIGAGPAGSYAAKTAAESGAKVLLLEEHLAVGIPCHDTGWLIQTDFTEKILAILKDKLMLRRVKGFKICDAFTGEIFEDIKSNELGYLTPRSDFDKELAKLAVSAGAELLLNTRVTSFLRKKSQVCGVTTSSKTMPKIDADIIIVATGAAVLNSPLAMANFKDKQVPGVLTELTRTEGFTGGVIEIYRSTRRDIVPHMYFWPHARDTCFVGVPSLKKLEELKSNEEIVFSKKIKRAHPVQTYGYATSQHGGRGHEKIVGNGVMYVGEAAGASGTIHSMIMGQYAGTVAAKAIKSGDVNSGKLMEYQKIFKSSDINKSPFYWNYIVDFYGSYRKCLNRFKKIKV